MNIFSSTDGDVGEFLMLNCECLVSYKLISHENLTNLLEFLYIPTNYICRFREQINNL